MCNHWGCAPTILPVVILCCIWFFIFTIRAIALSLKNYEESKRPPKNSSIKGLIKLDKSKKSAGKL